MISNYIDEQMKQMSLPQDLFQKLRDDILQENIRDGEKLSEQFICNKYNVSRTPVREALQKLELDGLIEIIPNRGAFVKGFTKQDLADIYVMRAEYESIALRWAIERMTPKQLEQLREVSEFMEFYTMKGDAGKIFQLNSYFHQLIYSMSGNRVLQHILASYEVYTEKVRKKHAYPQEHLDIIAKEHQDIFDAINARDKDAASEAAYNHVKNAAIRAGLWSK